MRDGGGNAGEQKSVKHVCGVGSGDGDGDGGKGEGRHAVTADRWA